MQDSIRLSQLYGRGLRSIKKMRRRKKKDELSDYIPNAESLEAIHSKCFESHSLFEIGVTPLESLSATSITLPDLKLLLDFHLNLKVSLRELSSLCNEMKCIEGEGVDSRVLLKLFLPAFKRLTDKNRSIIRTKKRLDEREAEIARLRRSQYDLNTYVVPNLNAIELDVDALLSGLQKVSVGAKQKRALEPVFFEKLCHKFLAGSVEPEMLREFLRYNIDTQISPSESAAIVKLFADDGANSFSLIYLTSQLKLLALDRPCEMSIDVVNTKLEQARQEENERQKLRHIQSMFRLVDRNNDGCIDVYELQQFCKDVHLIVSEDSIDKLIAEAGADLPSFSSSDSTSMSFLEFKSIVERASKRKSSNLWYMILQALLRSPFPIHVDVKHKRDQGGEIEKEVQRRDSTEADSIVSSSSTCLAGSRVSRVSHLPTKLFDHTQSTVNNDVRDTSQHSYHARTHCDNCHRSDHRVQFCDKACSVCVPPCRLPPLKCRSFRTHVQELQEGSPVHKLVSLYI